MTLNGSRSLNTAPFALNGGDYTINWTASGAATGCAHYGALVSLDGAPGESFAGGQAGSGETHAYKLKKGQYYLRMNSGCNEWSVTISHQ